MNEYFFENKIFYRTNEFNPDRLTLVFIHGLTGSLSSWFAYEKLFENKYNIVTYDIRGHGKSKKFPKYPDYDVKNFAIDLHELVSYLQISKFVLIGHSFGTLIAAEYIKQHRENVVASIFLSPIVGMEKNFTSKILHFILKPIKVFNLFAFNPKPGSHIDYTKFPNTTDLHLKRMFADSLNTTLRVHLYCLAQSMVSGQEYLLGQIEIPVLIIHGEKDILAPVKNSLILSKEIKNSEVLILPKTNHLFVLNNVPEVSEAIESFIGKHQTTFS